MASISSSLTPAYVLLSQLEFNVLCSFLYFSFWVCFDFFILKSLPTKGASPFNSCWETSAQWRHTARQCRRPDETSFGQASTTCAWPLQLGCLEHITDDADFWNGSLVLWMWKHAVCFHTWKLFKERSEIFAFMRIHWTFFDWLQTNFFFYHIWRLLPMCAYRNWRHLHS